MSVDLLVCKIHCGTKKVTIFSNLATLRATQTSSLATALRFMRSESNYMKIIVNNQYFMYSSQSLNIEFCFAFLGLQTKLNWLWLHNCTEERKPTSRIWFCVQICRTIWGWSNISWQGIWTLFKGIVLSIEICKHCETRGMGQYWRRPVSVNILYHIPTILFLLTAYY